MSNSKSKNILYFLRSKSRWFIFYLVLLGIINSVLSSLILIFINAIISKQSVFGVTEHLVYIFFGVVLLSLLTNHFFQSYLIKITNDILLEFELFILRKLKFASYQDFEKIGFERVYTSIADARSLAGVPEAFVTSVNAVVVIIVGVSYLFTLSLFGGAFILALMIVLFYIYSFRSERISKHLNEVRDLQDLYHTYLNDLLRGFKELKLSIEKNEGLYHEFLVKNREEGKQKNIKASASFLNNELTGTYSWYFVLGVMLFVLPNLFAMESSQVATMVITLLYLMSPVRELIGWMPTFSRTKIAVERIQQLDSEIEENVSEDYGEAPETGDNFQSLVFDNVVFNYPKKDDADKEFKLGPINLEIQKGGIVFITGGNGSGKSTLINLITGLYRPTSGAIFYNGSQLSLANFAHYSDKIAAVFTTPHLFSENYGNTDIKHAQGKVQHYIEMMRLSTVLKFDEKRNYYFQRLSKGQEKRLALIYALMEEKKILVLDEWAAEQDPEFRAYFYEVILADLAKMGKTVIAITHDDKFFDCADRIIKLDYGKIVSELVICETVNS